VRAGRSGRVAACSARPHRTCPNPLPRLTPFVRAPRVGPATALSASLCSCSAHPAGGSEGAELAPQMAETQLWRWSVPSRETLRSVGRSRRNAAHGDYSCARAGVFSRMPGEPAYRSPRIALRVWVSGPAFTTATTDRDALWSHYTRGPAGGGLTGSTCVAPTCATHPQPFRTVRLFR